MLWKVSCRFQDHVEVITWAQVKVTFQWISLFGCSQKCNRSVSKIGRTTKGLAVEPTGRLTLAKQWKFIWARRSYFCDGGRPAIWSRSTDIQSEVSKAVELAHLANSLGVEIVAIVSQSSQ